jgi:hypothetical protein
MPPIALVYALALFTVTFVPFLCLPKYLCYLHMENHAFGETLALRFISQPWAIPNL